MVDVVLNSRAQPVYLVNPFSGEPYTLASAADGATTLVGTADLDTDGNIVPTYKAHSYTYDASGNLATDTVTDGVNTWVRNYTTSPTGVTADSGWVKQ